VLAADRPNRRTRRQRGKSDPIDAEAAARAVLAGTATALPKRRDGMVEAIRVLRGVRAGAVKAGPADLREAAVVAGPPARGGDPGQKAATRSRPKIGHRAATTLPPPSL
jgi:transposase